jgi:hypothetical protein
MIFNLTKNFLNVKLVRELDFPNQFRAGHQDSAKGGKFQFPHEQEGFSTSPEGEHSKFSLVFNLPP